MLLNVSAVTGFTVIKLVDSSSSTNESTVILNKVNEDTTESQSDIQQVDELNEDEITRIKTNMNEQFLKGKLTGVRILLTML